MSFMEYRVLEQDKSVPGLRQAIQRLANTSSRQKRTGITWSSTDIAIITRYTGEVGLLDAS